MVISFTNCLICLGEGGKNDDDLPENLDSVDAEENGPLITWQATAKSNSSKLSLKERTLF